MRGVFEKVGIDFKTYVTTLNQTGVKIVSST